MLRSASSRLLHQIASVKADQFLYPQHNVKQMHFYADGVCFIFM